MTPLELSKERLLIPDLAALRGWDWKPGHSCRCPYRPDRNASGSVLQDGRLFHDFSTGENLDAPALLARMEEMSNEAACRLFIELAGAKRGGARAPLFYGDAPALLKPVSTVRSEKAHGKPDLPALAKPNPAQLRQIANLRGLGMEGVQLATRRGFLRATRFRGFAVWALTDETGFHCQFRRMDGLLFPRKDLDGYKAHTCRGSWQAWPLGISEAAKFGSVALVEGGGDFLAACHFIAVENTEWQVAPVAMLGAAQHIPAEALKLFEGKRVRIFAHVDKPNPQGEHPGIEAAARWEDQLRKAGATATTFDLSGLTRADGKPVKDLNDLARIAPGDFENEPELSAIMTF